jgi:hypothetical protein
VPFLPRQQSCHTAGPTSSFRAGSAVLSKSWPTGRIPFLLPTRTVDLPSLGSLPKLAASSPFTSQLSPEGGIPPLPHLLPFPVAAFLSRSFVAWLD